VTKTSSDQRRCLVLSKKHSFCGKHTDIEGLHDAVSLQQQRLQSVAQLVSQHADQQRAKLAEPDGTWFKDFQPRDGSTMYPGMQPPGVYSDTLDREEVVSPQQVWEEAYDDLQ